ncbi:MAG: gamma-glutamyltransferase, partial [Alphaproteobacteria bacterium]
PRTDGSLEVEAGFPTHIARGLAGMGHRVTPPERPIGGGQAIWIDWRRNILIGGSDPRKDGCALGF